MIAVHIDVAITIAGVGAALVTGHDTISGNVVCRRRLGRSSGGVPLAGGRYFALAFRQITKIVAIGVHITTTLPRIGTILVTKHGAIGVGLNVGRFRFRGCVHLLTFTKIAKIVAIEIDVAPALAREGTATITGDDTIGVRYAVGSRIRLRRGRCGVRSLPEIEKVERRDQRGGADNAHQLQEIAPIDVLLLGC